MVIAVKKQFPSRAAGERRVSMMIYMDSEVFYVATSATSVGLVRDSDHLGPTLQSFELWEKPLAERAVPSGLD